MKTLKTIKKIVGIIFFLIVIIVGALVVLLKVNEVGGRKLLVVKSGSMEPTIKTGSLIVIKKESEYKKDDIVTFGPDSRPDLLVTHRIIEEVEKNGASYIRTKGDFNSSPDVELTPKASIIGKYEFGVPLVGYLVDFAKTPAGVAILVLIPGTIIVYEEVKNIKEISTDYWRKRKEKKVTKKTESKKTKKK